jgi:hypothetical protein
MVLAWQFVCHCNGRTILKLFWNRVLRRVFETEKEEETEGRRKEHDPELCN